VSVHNKSVNGRPAPARRQRDKAPVRCLDPRYEDYLAWRTTRGFTGTFEAMLTEPLVINYYDEVFYSPGIAASPSAPAAGA
jgi:hypothetical protein